MSEFRLCRDELSWSGDRTSNPGVSNGTEVQFLLPCDFCLFFLPLYVKQAFEKTLVEHLLIFNMELLGVYCDDSDNEIGNTAKQLTLSSSAGNLSRPASKFKDSTDKHNKPLRKKKKKLDISFLPESIQTALARGDTNRDSDSEGEAGSTTRPPSKTHQPNVPALLMMLPKPKNDESMVSTERAHIVAGAVVKSKEDEDYRESPSRDKSNDSNRVVTVDDASSDSESDNDQTIMPDPYPALPPTSALPLPKPVSQGLSSKPTWVPKTSLPSFSSAPDMTSTIHVAPTSSAHIPAYSASSSSQLQHGSNAQLLSDSSSSSSSGNYTQSLCSSHGYSSLSSSTTVKGNPPRKSVAANRKRERDIHLGLLQGDVSVIEMEGNFIDVRPTNEWDNSAYMAQQERQRELQSMFNFSEKGGDKMMSQPTKLQNKRHQINSLAFSAAESELELLEARGRQMKTKYETQAKYGW